MTTTTSTRRSTRQPYHAVRVTVYTTGDTFTRDYVRDQRHMGTAAFDAYAVGDLLTLVGLTRTPDDRPGRIAITDIVVTELSPRQVWENDRYHHTSH